MISDRIYDDIPPQLMILYVVIPIVMYFLTFTHRKHFILCVSDVNHYIDQSLATLFLTSGFRWYISYTVAKS